jgi:hypothetical protein
MNVSRFEFINEPVPAANLETFVYALAKTIRTRSPEAIRSSKETMRVLSEAVAINPPNTSMTARHEKAWPRRANGLSWPE